MSAAAETPRAHALWLVPLGFFVLLSSRFALASLGSATLWFQLSAGPQQALALEEMDNTTLALLVLFWRLCFSALFLLLACAIHWLSSRSSDPAISAEPAHDRDLADDLLHHTGKGAENARLQSAILWRAVVSSVALTLNNALWSFAISHTSIASTYLLGCMDPPVLIIVLVLLRRKVSGGEKVGSVLAVVGAALLAFGPEWAGRVEASGRGAPTLVGDAAAFASCLFNIVMILAAEMPANHSGGAFLGFSCVIAGLSSLLLFCHLASGHVGVRALVPADGELTAFALYAGIIPGVMGIFGPWLALRFLSPALVSMSSPLQCIFASVIGVASGLAAVPSTFEIVGGVAVVAAVTLAAWGKEGAKAGGDCDSPHGPIFAKEVCERLPGSRLPLLAHDGCP